ncbi:MAG: DotU family type IV/VI secretion system protein [Planctomycetaceae bacterium]
MTPEYSHEVNEYIKTVLELSDKLQHAESMSLEHEAQRLRGALNTLQEKLSVNTKSSPKDIELTKRALIYWTDEILTVSDGQWTNEILEFKEYGTALRAEDFYIIGVSEAMNSHPDVVELWFLCLALGFHGYIKGAFDQMNRPLPGGKNDPDDAREAWAEELKGLFRPTKRVDAPQPEQLQGSTSHLEGFRLLSMSIALLVFSLVVFAGLLIVHFLVSDDGYVDEFSDDEAEEIGYE